MARGAAAGPGILAPGLAPAGQPACAGRSAAVHFLVVEEQLDCPVPIPLPGARGSTYSPAAGGVNVPVQRIEYLSPLTAAITAALLP